MSYLEIYGIKEEIRDLLNPKSNNLKIRESHNEIFVQNLSFKYVSSTDEVMQLLAQGERNRTTTSTMSNEVSSRSHSILILHNVFKLLDGRELSSKLINVDLAGSERVSKTLASGTTLEEGKAINSSLSALGLCIDAISSNRKHV